MLRQLQLFLAMGGFGAYIWSAYGVVILVFAINIFHGVWKSKKIIQKLKKSQLQPEGANS